MIMMIYCGEGVGAGRAAAPSLSGDIMAKIMHVQTVLLVDDIEALKVKTGEASTKEALAKAVYHFLECEYAHDENMWARKLEKVVEKKSGAMNV
jgi:hypothetical protein